MCSKKEYHIHPAWITDGQQMIKDNPKRKNHRVGSKLYVGMTTKEVKKLLTDKCKKCKHLIDDHFLPVNTFETKTNKTYTCRYCGCKRK